MNESICKGRGFNCNLDCTKKETCNQYVDSKIKLEDLEIAHLPIDKTGLKIKYEGEL